MRRGDRPFRARPPQGLGYIHALLSENAGRVEGARLWPGPGSSVEQKCRSKSPLEIAAAWDVATIAPRADAEPEQSIARQRTVLLCPAVNGEVPAREALARLREGNRRFAGNVRSLDSLLSHTRRSELAAAQQPFAIVLGCSDSRVPAEMVFDQGLGDLFVIRVAGNIVAPSQVGSIEFAAARYGTRLVVVMGHSQCGVILATIESMESPGATESHNLRAIVDRVRPSVEPLMNSGLARDRQSLIRESVRANVRASARHLRHGSQMLEQLIAEHGLLVVGAEYDLETGEVDFFDGPPEGT